MKQLKFLILFTILITFTTTSHVRAYGIESSFTTITGNIQSFSSYQAKMLLVDATATWCTSCDVQLQHLQDVYDSIDNTVNIITLSIDPSDTIPKLVKLKNRFSSPWTFGLDLDSEFMDHFLVEFLPTLFLFDENGNILKKWEGITQPSVILDTINSNTDISFDAAFKNGGNQAGYTSSLLSDLFANPTFKVILLIVVSLFLYLKLVPVKPKETDISKEATKSTNK